MISRTSLFAAGLLAACLLFGPVAGRAGTVRDVTFTTDPARNSIDVNVTVDQHVAYRAFLLDDPQRAVIDFPALGWQAPEDARDTAGLVTRYRHALNDNKGLRIVFDVSQQVKIVKTETRVAGANYRYIVRLQLPQSAKLNQSISEPDRPATEMTRTVTTTRKVRDANEPPAPVVSQKSPPDSGAGIKTIVIDAGHGGVDPGAIATNGAYEKNITLGVARDLRELLEATGRYKVKMTRDSDVFVILQNRVKIARKAKGDLFVSLHADTIARPAVQGASVYSLSDKASDAEAARLAERENQVDALVGGVDLGVQDKDVADILLDLVVRDNMNQSKILADTMVEGLRQGGVQTLDGSHRFAGFAVLKAPDIPSILVEMGYLSNPSEADRLNSPAHRKRIARAVKDAIDVYFNETSKKTEF